MSTSFGNMMDSTSDSQASGSSMDKDLERFIEEENQKQRFQHLVGELNEKCFDVCVEKPGQRMDAKTETCLSNCVNRFIDTSNYIMQRLEKIGNSRSTEMEFS